MDNKTKLAIAITVVFGAFAFGRYSAPITVKTVEVEKKETKDNSKTDIEKKKKAVIVDVTLPDGTHKKTTTITEDDSNKKTDNTTVEDDTTKSKEVVKEKSKLTIAALAGVKPSFSSPMTPIYGAQVSKEIIGPLSFGLFGLSNGVCGASVGISF